MAAEQRLDSLGNRVWATLSFYLFPYKAVLNWANVGRTSQKNVKAVGAVGVLPGADGERGHLADLGPCQSVTRRRHRPVVDNVHGERRVYSAPRRIDSVVVLRPTRHKIGHFGDVSPSQSLGPDPLKENVSL